MPDGGRLSISLYEENPLAVAIEVRDTGFGMDEETLRRAFEPFFTTKPVGKGTGLGMSMVYGLMSQHGGRVTLESSPGQGTSVKLWFPTEAHPIAPGPVAAEAVSGRGGNERILLVEDEDAVRRIGRRVLERLGYEVTEAADGLAALTVLEQHPSGFDLILSDRVMPGMGGIELQRELTKRGIGIRFLLATAYPDGGSLPRVLQKPWTSETLTAAIRRALEEPIEPVR